MHILPVNKQKRWAVSFALLFLILQEKPQHNLWLMHVQLQVVLEIKICTDSNTQMYFAGSYSYLKSVKPTFMEN